MNYDVIKLIVGATATLALYSILYKENKFYRLFEHIYIGLAVGYAIVSLWVENLQDSWWNMMLGKAPTPDDAAGSPAMYFFAILLPVAFMGFMVFSKKHGWMARIPIGIILGVWGAQQFKAFQTEITPQIVDSAKYVLPTTMSSIAVPNGVQLAPDRLARLVQQSGLTEDQVREVAANIRLTDDGQKQLIAKMGVEPEKIANIQATVSEVIDNNVYTTQAINNIIYVVTLLSVLSYFLFSFELKGKFLNGMTRAGRLLLMVGFGAIFGSTVMTRFALLIDRMYFIWIEFLKDGIGKLFGGG